MTFNNFDAFNHYLGVEKPISEKIDFGIYHQELPLKIKSEAINVDFYRISLKENISFHSINQKVSHLQTILFFNSLNQNFEWELHNKWTGFYIQISKEIIDKHRFLFRNCLEYGLHEALIIEENDAKEIKQIFNLLQTHYSDENYDFEIVLSYANIIISLVEKLYQKQFSTHQKEYNWIVKDFQQLLNDYYKNEVSKTPNVSYFAKKMNVSPNYLGDVIKHFTGNNAKDLIQNHIIATAQNYFLPLG